jgi:hypothetical protein
VPCPSVLITSRTPPLWRPEQVRVSDMLCILAADRVRPLFNTALADNRFMFRTIRSVAAGCPDVKVRLAEHGARQ